MKKTLINLLRCPKTGQSLILTEQDSILSTRKSAVEDSSDEIFEGILTNADGTYSYAIRGGIPRFVPESNYADNFGMQWNHFAKTQLDSCSGYPISAERFWRATNWRPEEMKDSWVLDVGCGSGRFAEIALKSGAQVVALDYSSAVDACWSNLKHHPNLHVLQADIYELPLALESFGFVYSLGVLQHTPDVAKAFFALPPVVAEGGRLCVDFYWKRWKTMLHMKYLLRPITKHIPQLILFKSLQLTVPFLFWISYFLGKIPCIGIGLQRLVPVANYAGVYPLSDKQLREWALLDTFDWLAPKYDNPQTAPQIYSWFKSVDLSDIEILHVGHLVARARK